MRAMSVPADERESGDPHFYTISSGDLRPWSKQFFR
jgi:hypothetical protein